jgi:hypothetical protein
MVTPCPSAPPMNQTVKRKTNLRAETAVRSSPSQRRKSPRTNSYAIIALADTRTQRTACAVLWERENTKALT